MHVKVLSLMTLINYLKQKIPLEKEGNILLLQIYERVILTALLKGKGFLIHRPRLTKELVYTPYESKCRF